MQQPSGSEMDLNPRQQSTESIIPKNVEKTFRTVERSYDGTPVGWRLATYEEAKNGIETIKKKQLLKRWDRARLLDGWISGAGYDYEIGDDFKGCLGYMLLIQIQTQASGCAYADVQLSDRGKKVALFLCVDDWNYEVVYWLLYSWSNSEIMNVGEVRGGNIPFSNVHKFKEMNKMIGHLATRLEEEGGAALQKAKKTNSSGIQNSVREVLSGMMKVVKEEKDNVYFTRVIWRHITPATYEYSLPDSIKTENILDSFWSFVCDNFAGYVVEVCATRCLLDMLKMITLESTSQSNLMIATSILLHLSDFRRAILHEPLGHYCNGNCAAKMLKEAEEKTASNPEKFYEILKNNAISSSYDDILDKLLFTVAKPKYNDIEGREKISVVDMLLKCGARPGRNYAIRKYKNKTILHSVAKYREKDVGIEVAQALLLRCDEETINNLVKAADERGRTALHNASERGNEGIADFLLDHGASVIAQDKEGMTALHYAFQGEIDTVVSMGTEIVKVLLERCDEKNISHFVNAIDKNRRTALHRASEKGNAGICGLLVDHGALVTAQDEKDRTALHYAFEGEIDRVINVGTQIVEALLERCDEGNIRYFVNAKDKGQRTALHGASEKGNSRICELLLDRGASVTDKDENGKTALHYAFEGEIDRVIGMGIDIAKLLLCKCDEKNKHDFVNGADERERTALHGASEKGNAHICGLLLNCGALVTAQDKKGKTALHYAFEGGVDKDIDVATEIAEVLLRDKQNIGIFVDAADSKDKTALHRASEKGNARICKLLVEEGASLIARDNIGKTALHYALEGAIDKILGVGTEIAQTLIGRCNEQSISEFVNAADEKGTTCLHMASLKGNSRICQLLIDKGASVIAQDKTGRTALHYAFEGEVDKDIDVERYIAQALLDKCDGQNIRTFVNAEDESRRTALHGASKEGNVRICELLIKKGASVRTRDKNGMTALHYAFEEGIDKDINVETEIAKVLLHLCDAENIRDFVNTRDVYGRTALHLSSEKGNAYICELLVEKGASLTAQDEMGMTAMHYAFERGIDKDIDVGIGIAISLLNKCDKKDTYEFVNAADNRRKTALHLASEKGSADICGLLIHGGALLNAQDIDGKTALHYAVGGNYKVLDVLLKSCHAIYSLDLRDKRGCTPLDITLANKDFRSTAKLLSKSKGSERYLDRTLSNMNYESGANLLSKSTMSDASCFLRDSLLLGSVDIVAKLFEKGIKLPAGDHDEDGKTAFHLAAMCDSESNAFEMIVSWIEGPNPEILENMVAVRDRRRRTVLHEAALNGYNELCQGLLLLNSELIFMKDRNDRSPLHDAAEGKYKGRALTKQLLKAYLKKVRPQGDLVDSTGLTPLHVAASKGKAQVVKVLLSNDKIKTEYVSKGDILSQTALHKAAKCGDVDTVQILLDRGAHPLKERDSDGRTALHYVVQAQSEHKVKLAELLFDKCKSNEEQSLLLWASAAGLGTVGNLNPDGPLRVFFEEKKKLLKGDKSFEDTFNGNLLKIAAAQGDIEMTKEMISRGYQIEDIRDPKWKKKLEKDIREKKLKGDILKNVEKVSRHIEMIKEQGNDKPTMSDNLGRLDYAQGLAALFLNPYIKPPIAVGITGTWGMGKSSLMLQTECVLLATAAHIALLPSSKLSSSALELPDITPWKMSKKGERKRERICREIKRAEQLDRSIFAVLWDCIKTEVIPTCMKGSQEEELGKFLNESENKFLKQHDLKYLKIFKALAAMDSSDMSRPNADPSADENVHAVLTVQYNAWKYKDEMEALAGLAVEITKELEGIMSQAQWLNTCWRNAWIKNKYTLCIEFFLLPLLALVLVGSFTWIAWVVFGSEKLKEWGNVKYAWPPAAFVTIVWTVTKSTMGILKPVSTQLMQYMSFPDHSEKLGYQDRVISDIRFLRNEIGRKAFWVFIVFAWVWTNFIALWDIVTGSRITSFIFHQRSREKAIKAPQIAPAPGSDLRIIVFVDDLDRCEESVILQVLSAVNLVLGVLEISVVIGMDKRLLERAIMNKYKDVKADESLEAKELADMYLQKIIQLPLDLPDPSEKESQKFLTGQLGALENEVVPPLTKDNERSSNNGGERTVVHHDNARDHTITVETTGEIEHIGSLNLLERSVPTESREATTSETVAGPTTIGSSNLPQGSAPAEARIEALSQTDGNATIRGKQEQSSSLIIREMLFVRYSKGEEEAFLYFQKSATGYRKLPREWKRLLNYHRLVWYIFSASNEAKYLDGWQVQLITWIFICWEWREYMNVVIEKWKEIGDLKAPSLLRVVEHLIDTKATSYENSQEARLEKSDNSMENKLNALEKMLADLTKEMKELKGLPSDQMKNNIKELTKQVSTDLKEDIKEIKEQMAEKGNVKNEGIKEVKEQITKEKSARNEKQWNKNWQRMKSALEKYNVSMQGIQVFQRFRFHCKSGYLPPLGTHIK